MSHQKRPIKTVSFADLRDIGITIFTQEFTKEFPDGTAKPSVKVVRAVKTNKNGEEVDFSREHMQEILYVLGIDTYACKWWVVPKKGHRRILDNLPVNDYRYMGYERLDRDWLMSGHASEDAIMRSSRMKDMDATTRKMKQGGDDE